jgi:tRNA 2-thiocytidine biosynthesis protein TtcA
MDAPTAEPHALQKLFAGAPDSVTFRRLRKRLARETLETTRRYGLITARADGLLPRWLVCLSGGKDSYTLLSVLMDLQAQGLLPVDLIACNLDQGQPGFPKTVLPDYLSAMGIAYRIITEDTYSIVKDKVPEGHVYCSLCSRLRRGILYRVAREEGCDAIVLGHHRDDALATFMMNLVHGGRLAAMPPKLLNDEGDILVLRPLLQCAEADIAKYSDLMGFPIIPCNLCGSQDGLQRQAMDRMLSDWEMRRPGTRANLLKALTQVRVSHLADPDVYDFAGLKPGGTGTPEDGVPF